MTLLLTIALSTFAATPAPVEAVTTQPVVKGQTQQLGRAVSLTGFVLLAATSLAEGINVGVLAWNGPSGLLGAPLLGAVGSVPLLGGVAMTYLHAQTVSPDHGFLVRSGLLLAGQVVGAVTALVGLHLENSPRAPLVTVAPLEGGALMTAGFQF